MVLKQCFRLIKWTSTNTNKICKWLYFYICCIVTRRCFQIILLCYFHDWLLYHLTRYSDYHWILLLVMRTYIHDFLKKKERIEDSESPETFLSGTNVVILWRTLQKNKSIQIWVLEIFLVEFFHYLWPRCHDQRRLGPELAPNTLVQPLPPPVENELLVVNKRSITRYSWCKRRLF